MRRVHWAVPTREIRQRSNQFTVLHPHTVFAPRMQWLETSKINRFLRGGSQSLVYIRSERAENRLQSGLCAVRTSSCKHLPLGLASVLLEMRK